MNKQHYFKWRGVHSLFVAFLFLGIVFTSTSCKKKDNLFGGKAYPQEDLLNSGGVDTFSLTTYTVEEDSVYAKSPNSVLLGIMNDPEMGIVDLGFYSQALLSGLSPNFGDISNMVMDSFVLSLEYNGSYGYTGNQTIEVYEVNQPMYFDSLYFANTDLSTLTDNWVEGSGTYEINPETLTVVGGDTLSSQLRIQLDTNIARQIIEDAANFPAEFADNSLFVENYLNGIYVKTNGVTPSENQGIVGYFDLMSQESKMTIYYSINNIQQAPFELIFNNECVFYNRYKINNVGKQIESVLADSTLGQVEFYAQAGKYRGVLAFPTLKNLPKNIVVHNAKIVLPVEHYPGSKFLYSPTVKLTVKDDFSFLPITATYDLTQRGYVADVRAYVQDFTLGITTKKLLEITPGTSFIGTTDRIIFNGPNTDNKLKPKLIISFTEF